MNAPESSRAAALLPIAQIVASPSNPRRHFDDASLQGLAESIKSHGVLQPILVRPLSLDGLLDYNRSNHTTSGIPPAYELVSGERRWRAAQVAGLTEIPAFWRELSDEDTLEIQIIENLQREDVDALDEADGYQRLVSQFGHSAEQIGVRIGKSRSYVYGRLKLTDLGSAGREAFQSGKLDASTALLVARIKGDALQKKAVKALTTEGYGGAPKSYRDALHYIRYQFTISLKQASFNPADEFLLPDAGACSACPHLSGNDPVIFADIADADVCTETNCFANKKQARRDQLLALAEARQIPVYSGAEAREVISPGLYPQDDRYVALDADADDDAEGRTWREILGAHAPAAAAMAEVGYSEQDKRLVELVDTGALKAALEAAGWAPSTGSGEEEGAPGETEQQKAQRAKAQAAAAAQRAEFETKVKRADEENAYREGLANGVLASATKVFRGEPALAFAAIRFYAIAKVRADAAYGGHDCALLARWGQPVPDSYDEVEEAEKFVERLESSSLADIVVFLLDGITSAERTVYTHQFDPETDRPTTLLALAALLKTATLRVEAAPAEEKGTASTAAPEAVPAKKTKGKAKAKTAPALPANDPATPDKSTAAGFTAAWPFPEQS